MSFTPLLSPAVCTPFGLSTMFTVTGKLLVKPRVSCPLRGPTAMGWGLCVPNAMGLPRVYDMRVPDGCRPSAAPGGPG